MKLIVPAILIILIAVGVAWLGLTQPEIPTKMVEQSVDTKQFLDIQ